MIGHLKASVADRCAASTYVRIIEDVSFLVNRDDDKIPVTVGKAKELDGALLAVAVIFGVFGALVLGFMAYIIHRVKHRHLYMQVTSHMNLNTLCHATGSLRMAVECLMQNTALHDIMVPYNNEIKRRASSKYALLPGIFQRGADSSDEGAKIWFSGYYKCQKSPKKLLFTFRRGLACSDGGGYHLLALPWRHP